MDLLVMTQIRACGCSATKTRTANEGYEDFNRHSNTQERSIVFRCVVLAVLLGAARSHQCAAQVISTTTLEVDVENIVSYSSDVFDASKFATDPNLTTVVAGARNFGFIMAIGDIVAVNGKPAKGTLLVRLQSVVLNPAPNPGQGMADITRTAVSDYLVEIQQADGSPVGNIHTLGLSGGTAPPGAPLGVQLGGNHSVAGGTGAFVGVRGQMANVTLGPPPRTASVTEDPARRRVSGGGRVRFVYQLIPATQPEIVSTLSGPSIFHADFSPVTGGRPMRAGEIVIVRATGLGPTRPGVNPGQPFPTDTLQEVNSPVEVLVGGRAAEVVNKVGWPGLTDTYRVDFRVPDGTSAGLATIRLSAAWVAGPEVQIAIQ
jgi:uncharacterized protein (TIGR03437 family)